MASFNSYYISFANKYYTLWDVTVNHIIDEEAGYSYDDVRAVYIKNISMDKDVVLEQYPDTPWDTNLQGKSMRFKSNEKCIIPPHSFRYGKYKHMAYSDCTDYNYMVWFFNDKMFEEIDTDIQPLIDNVITNTDYVLYKGGSYYKLMTKEEYEDILDYENYNKEIAATFNEGYAIVEVDSNWLGEYEIDGEAYYRLSTYDHFYFYFRGDDVRYYEGNYYSSGGYKPAIKGKGKNLKNKKVKLYITPAIIHSKDKWYDKKEFIVTGFEIL